MAKGISFMDGILFLIEKEMFDYDKEEQMEEYEVILIPVSDGTEKEFAIMDRFTVKDKQYIAVSLVEQEQIVDGIYIYRGQDTEDGEILVEQIEALEEYKEVTEFYENLV